MRAVGNLQFLKDAAGPNGSRSKHGLGHTRWATHGAVTEQNAHPLTGCDDGRLAIVLNGIIENYRELQAIARSRGPSLHLRDGRGSGRAPDRAALRRRSRRGRARASTACSRGTSRSSSIHHDHPDLLVGARHQCPLVVGVGEGEMFLASSIAAFLRETRQVQLIEDGEVVAITPEGARFFTRWRRGRAQGRSSRVDWDDEGAEKGGYETFMLKEIYEQPEAVRETIGDRARRGQARPRRASASTELEIRNLRRIVIVACGTAYHAGVVGRYIIEEWARVPVEPDIASEWRYRNPVLSKDTLVIGITQSGETADTIAAMRLAREQGARTLAITNMLGTQITREVGRASSTRAPASRSASRRRRRSPRRSPLLSLIALKLAQIRRTLPDGRDRVHPRGARTTCREDGAIPGRRPSDRGDRASATTTSRSSSTSGATSACPSRSRARSS